MTQWTLKNTGEKAWPKGVQCQQIGYNEVEFRFVRVEIESDCCKIVRNCQSDNSLGIDDYEVDVFDEMTIYIEVTMPEKEGIYELKFTLQLEGEQASQRFGEQVCLSLCS